METDGDSFSRSGGFSRLYVGQDSFTPDFFWNRTHIQIATFFRVFTIDENSTITIRVWDTSFNLAEYKTEAAEDLQSPTIEIITPYDGEVLEERKILVEWNVTDKSGISRIELLINDIPFIDLSVNQAQVEVELPIAEGEPRNLTLAIRATDQFNNTAMKVIRIEYFPGKYSTTQGLLDVLTQPNFERKTINLILGISSILFIVLLLATYFTIFRKSESKDDDSEVKRHWNGNIPSPPFLQLLKMVSKMNTEDFLNKMEWLLQLENKWNEIESNLTKKRRLKRKELIKEINSFADQMKDEFKRKTPDLELHIFVLVDNWRTYFETPPQPVLSSHVSTFKEEFPKDDIQGFLKSQGISNTKIKRFIEIFEQEWIESFERLELGSSIYEILNFRAEFAAELYLTLLYLTNFRKSVQSEVERIARRLN